MSKIITKQLEKITKDFESVYDALESIAADLNAINEKRTQIENTEHYTQVYKSEVVEKVENEFTGDIAKSILAVNSSITDIVNNTEAIFEAEDVLEDAALSLAVNTVSMLDASKRSSGDTVELIISRFAGNFPALDLLASIAPEGLNNLFFARSLNKDDLENIVDGISEAVFALETTNRAGVLINMPSYVTALAKKIEKMRELYGVEIDKAKYTSLASLSESDEAAKVRAAFGL